MTESQRLAFDLQGFLTLPGALSPDHLARVREAADRAEAAWRTNEGLPGRRSPELDQVQSPTRLAPEIRDLLWHEPVVGIVRETLGGRARHVDDDYFITPPGGARTHADWHHDVGMPGVRHAGSVLMVKVFYLLTDVGPDSGGTAMLPGSHLLSDGYRFPAPSDPAAMPGAVQMTGRAGDAYLFNGRVYHCAVENRAGYARRVLIFNYGQPWMRCWQGYEPTPEIIEAAGNDPLRREILGLGDPY